MLTFYQLMKKNFKRSYASRGSNQKSRINKIKRISASTQSIRLYSFKANHKYQMHTKMKLDFSNILIKRKAQTEVKLT